MTTLQRTATTTEVVEPSEYDERVADLQLSNESGRAQ